MKFDTSNQIESGKALNRVMELIQKKKVVEIIAVSPKRSLNQNNYLHLLLGYFGMHFGHYTIEEAKQVYKQMNKDIYLYKKGDHVFIKSSADLTKEEMTRSIDVFRKVSAENGLDLPSATDQDCLREIGNQIERGEMT